MNIIKQSSHSGDCQQTKQFYFIHKIKKQYSRKNKTESAGEDYWKELTIKTEFNKANYLFISNSKYHSEKIQNKPVLCNNYRKINLYDFRVYCNNHLLILKKEQLWHFLYHNTFINIYALLATTFILSLVKGLKGSFKKYLLLV